MKVVIDIYPDVYCSFQMSSDIPCPLADAIKAVVRKEVEHFYKNED